MRPAPAPMPEPGDRIDSYHLLEQIGVGGMGAVYRAQDQRLDRPVALKLLPPEQSGDIEVVQRFYQEARAAARLDHENIARVFTIGHEDTRHFIAFEYIEGTNIRQLVAEHGPLSVTETINHSLQIANALVHASERGVVHRDIKPSNIIVTPSGRAKLVDMGLARRFERGQSADEGLTHSGMTLGTFDYISPEQARDPRDVDVRSDLYSLGCTMFHMLTGRPPFPEGTVLQKLLQHQEEPAPDVRKVNPEVPVELSTILLRLMAKDRDRRYQSPEQLVRDLLGLAGALGLRSVNPEGLVWQPDGGQAAWHRHAIWAVPTLALLGVVGFLVWSGWSDQRPPTLADVPPLMTSRPVAAPRKEASRPPAAVASAPDSSPRKTASVAASTSAILLTRVGAADDLRDRIDRAADGAILELTDGGPYSLPLVRLEGLDGSPPTRRLTIRAAKGVRPVLRPARAGVAATTLSSPAALLAFRGGQVVLDGLEFAIRNGEVEQPLSLVAASGTDLRLSRCVFRRSGEGAGSDQLAAVHLLDLASPGPAERTQPVVLQESHFDGGQVGLWAEGPADIEIKDCTFGPAVTSFRIDGAAALPRLTLRHVSVLAGTGPIFRFTGGRATVRMDDSIVAPAPGSRETTLVAADRPDQLDWVGRDNFYARVGTFLQPTTGAPLVTALRPFQAWSDGDTVREIGSSSSIVNVWLQDDPASLLGRSDPSAAFQIEPGEIPMSGIGARRGPRGPLESYPGMLAAATPARAASVPPAAAAPVVGPEPSTTATIQQTLSSSAATPLAPAEAPGEPSETILEPMTLAPMVNAPAGEALPAEPLARESAIGTETEASRTPAASGATLPPEPARADVATLPSPERTGPGLGTPNGGELRTSQQLRAALASASAPGAPIRLAQGIQYEISASILRGTNRWVIQGPERPNAARPVIRLRPQPGALASMSSLIEIVAGSLELKNVDLVAAEAPSKSGENVSGPLFAMPPGTALELDRCTITLAASSRRSAVIRVTVPAGTEAEDEPNRGATARLQFVDSFIRSAVGLLEVAPGLTTGFQAEGCLLICSGAVVQGHGMAGDDDPPPLSIAVDRSTVLASGGLVHLESEPEAPKLPLAEITVTDSILATGRLGEPLISIDGQGDLETLRDRVRWRGSNVAYHMINTYRRDRTSRPGSVPLRFSRPDWEVAVAPRDEGAFHGTVDFVVPWPSDLDPEALEPEDARIEPDEATSPRGPDLDRMPSPPPRKPRGAG